MFTSVIEDIEQAVHADNRELNELRERLEALAVRSGNTSASTREKLSEIAELFFENRYVKNPTLQSEKDLYVSDLLFVFIDEFRETYSQEELNTLRKTASDLRRIVRRNKRFQKLRNIVKPPSENGNFKDSLEGIKTTEMIKELTEFIEVYWDFDTFSPEFTLDCLSRISNVVNSVELPDLLEESRGADRQLDWFFKILGMKSTTDYRSEIQNLRRAIRELNNSIRRLLEESRAKLLIHSREPSLKSLLKHLGEDREDQIRKNQAAMDWVKVNIEKGRSEQEIQEAEEEFILLKAILDEGRSEDNKLFS